MPNIKNWNSHLLQNKSGFTLIELVMVIVIIAILSVVVAPRFFTSKGFEEYTYRSEVIALLRAVQAKAMQQANVVNPCHQVTLSSTRIYDDCGHEVQVETNHNVTFATNGSTVLVFDHQGKINCGASCPTIISITGLETLQLKIESQGYIHAI